MEIEIEYTHGNKYTKKWIGFCKRLTGGGFSLSYCFNGGRFGSEKEIFKGVEALKKEGYIVKSIKKVDELKY